MVPNQSPTRGHHVPKAPSPHSASAMNCSTIITWASGSASTPRRRPSAGIKPISMGRTICRKWGENVGIKCGDVGYFMGCDT